jgi:RNA polymerase sigma factor (sigma-70 family)
VIYNHIYYKTLNQSLTEDVVSDTFFKAFDKIHQFDYTTENSFRSRLYTIANNTLLDSYKKITPDQLDETFEYESDENITSSENNRYISEQILTELNKLSPSKKDLVVMRIRE